MKITTRQRLEAVAASDLLDSEARAELEAMLASDDTVICQIIDDESIEPLRRVEILKEAKGAARVAEAVVIGIVIGVILYNIAH